MKLKLVKAAQGLVWVRQGALACRQQALGFIGLLGMVGMAALLMIGLPEGVGNLLVVGVMPLVWMGFMLATRRVLSGQRVTPSVMIEAIKATDSPRLNFALLGLAYILATQLVSVLAQWLGPDPDALQNVMETTKEMAELVNNPLVQEDMLWRVALTVPVSLVFWHTPALILWARLPVVKALFFSVVAVWRNLGAFVVYGLSWASIVIVVGLLDRVVLALIPVPLLGSALALAAGMWLAAAFYASLYFTVVDCFEPQAAAGAGAPPATPAD